MLDDAISLLPPAKLLKIVRKYLDLKDLLPDDEKTTSSSLLANAKAFEKASFAGEYYESFNVNSKNFMEKSMGTTAWIAECRRLLDRCVVQAREGDAADVRQAFDIIFGMPDHIDESNDDIVFFADEGGSWQVGVDWDRILPSWFKVLSATAAPKEYAKRIVVLLDHHYKYGRDKMLAVTRKTATPEQRKALAEVTTNQQASRQRKGITP